MVGRLLDDLLQNGGRLRVLGFIADDLEIVQHDAACSTISLNDDMKDSSVLSETAWMSAERAWYQTSPFGSPVRSIILATSLTCQKIVPSRTSSTLSDVRTVYSKKAYCGRMSIFVTGTLNATDFAFLTTLFLTSSAEVPDDHIIVTCHQRGEG